jgi:hypothetical protein
LNGAAGAAPQHGVKAPDGTPDFLYFFLMFFILLNDCASGAAPQYGVGAPEYLFQLFL